MTFTRGNHTKGVGVDLIEVRRFRAFARNKKHAFLNKVFTKKELAYCFQYQDPAPHLAGFFAAKESASKALGVARHPFIELEVRHRSDGAPEIWHLGKRKTLQVSISHTKTLATAIAIR